MREHDVLKKNKNFYIGVGGTVLEGLLSGSLFLLLYSVMQFLWAGQFDLDRVLMLTGAIAGIFLLRILIYSYILYYLALHPGWTFTREQLYRYAMPDDFASGLESVTSRIYKIRKKLNINAIQTVHGYGYRFQK